MSFNKAVSIDVSNNAAVWLSMHALHSQQACDNRLQTHALRMIIAQDYHSEVIRVFCLCTISLADKITASFRKTKANNTGVICVRG